MMPPESRNGVRKVLIANRGEIAVRVARTCREMGLPVVAVYSTADRDSAVARLADQAVHIGPAPVKRSYLNVPAIIEAAQQTGADAIHPGYGFLSEDADFADICAANGITFIGPPSAVMRQLADKAEARAFMRDAGLPVLPGDGPVTSATEAREVADGIGYPLIIKAAAGGGGRGMRPVSDPRELVSVYKAVRAEAQAFFGNSSVYIERFLPVARHIEIQVLCDAHGGAVHLGERDCSVQRRRQKLIEETPAAGLPDGLAARMGEAAVRGAQKVGYEGAGTFEFLVDEAGRFYFMEINCRIQVEHPVTEMVTGIDLVREQIRVAGGEPLSIQQADVAPRGVAIEARINAEDPSRGFAPTAGLVAEFMPSCGPFTRVDTHVYPGWSVGADYDSLLAKQVVWAPDRAQAITRLDRALSEFRISGSNLCTTIEFIRDVLVDSRFTRAIHSTALVEDLLGENKANRRTVLPRDRKQPPR